MRYMLVLIALALGGCTYTLPNGEKVAREVYRAEAAQDLLSLAMAADREYDNRNPIQPPPEFCDGPQADMATAAICALSISAYNAQLQVREDRRKAHAAYATAVLDRQSAERERKIDRWFNLGLAVYQTERTASRQASAGPRISVRGHTVTSRGSGGGAAGAGGGGAEGVAGSGGGGGGAETGVNGDQNVVVVVGDNNQSSGGSSSTFAPALEYATDLGTTRPVFGEGAMDNRTLSDDASLLNGGIF